MNAKPRNPAVLAQMREALARADADIAAAVAERDRLLAVYREGAEYDPVVADALGHLGYKEESKK